MKLVEKLITALNRILQSILGGFRKPVPRAPPIRYVEITISEKPPFKELVSDSGVYIVKNGNKNLKWAILKCPCDCGNIINLSLQTAHNPHWVAQEEVSGRPTLHPSIWVAKGCKSHFWIKDGRVYWC